MLLFVVINFACAVKGISGNEEQMEDFFFILMHSSGVERIRVFYQAQLENFQSMYITNKNSLRENHLPDQCFP